MRCSVLALVSCLALVACDGSKSEPAAKPAQTPAGSEAADAKVAAQAQPDPAAEAHADGDHEGCIYADNQEGDRAACPGGEGEPAGDVQGDGHFGAAFALQQSTPLSKAVAEVKPEPVLVTGVVDAVCQKKGCWMVIKDGEKTARVLMKDHAFAVPKDARGKKARVEGTLQARTFTEAQVKHLEKDGGGDPSKVSGERSEYVLTASGVEIAS
jgi:hypothetical protein